MTDKLTDTPPFDTPSRLPAGTTDLNARHSSGVGTQPQGRLSDEDLDQASGGGNWWDPVVSNLTATMAPPPPPSVDPATVAHNAVMDFLKGVASQGKP
ncbi:hypothetical protein [Azospirillum sp.]|uniref:hypothetical protein n=1 Tax=Azospirillum sp. TaxID=34012 RepID=UPI002D3CBCF6|nr:hypothetical protein [Azospirillum sp.]HYD64013.1 hypothetical protein [Azospirillum sp.]